MRIGFYLENKDITGVDLSQIQLGNPGIGGTEFQFLLLIHLLRNQVVSGQNIDLLVFANEIENLDKSIKSIKTDSFLGALDLAGKSNLVDFLIYRPRRKRDLKIEEKISSGRTSILPWLHITPNRDVLEYFGREKNIAACIFVGDDQRMRCIDTAIFRKSVTIFNTYPDTQINHHRSLEETPPKNVTYLGALVPAKGFHVLAKAWPKVVKKVPEAKLHVIGSGNLYNHSADVGKFTQADIKYEKTFIKYLTKSGKLIESVTFHGRLGIEKATILSFTNVGIINPSGQTENCPVSAIEMTFASIPIVTSKKYGMRDMVVNGQNGFKVNSANALAERIIFLLQNSEQAKILGENSKFFSNEKFLPSKIVQEWIELIEALNKSELPSSLSRMKKGYYLHKLSWKLRNYFIIPKASPSVEDLKVFIIRQRARLIFWKRF